jgi:hypothetical protein
MPYRAEQGYLDQEESKDQTLEPDRANANDNGSSTPPAPKPYVPPTENAVKAPQPIQQAPTFAQMQAAGEARPPMPTESAVAAPPNSIKTLSGDWEAPTASAQSAPLIATAAGGTMTPQGDSANSFRGYQTDQGGGFGGAFADKGADAALWSSVANGDPKALQQGLSSADPALQKAAADSIARMLTMNDTEAAGVQMLKNLTPEQRALVEQSFVQGNPYAKDQAGYDARRDSGGQAALYKGTWDRLNSQIATAPSGLPVGRNAGNYTAKDPAEQQRLLAEMAAGKIPSGPTVYTTPTGQPTEGVAATPNKVQTTQNTPASAQTTAPASGGQSGVPSGAAPSSIDILGELMKGASGQGAGSAVQNATQQSILDQLKNPSSYGTKEVQDAYNWMGGNIDDEYTMAERDLQEEMAKRGLSASTIGSGRTRDLNVAKRTAKESLAYDLAQKLAETQSGDKRAAIAQGLTGGSTAQNSQLDWLKSLMGYGQQGFENDMATAKFNADQSNKWDDFLTRMLGLGYGGG